VYALHEVLRGTLEEGVEARWERHEQAGRRFAARAEEAGLEVLAEADHRLAPLTAIRVPDGIDGKDVQRRLLAEQGLEVGGGLGPTAPPIWRVGLMGPNAREQTADKVLAALTGVLEGERVPIAG
jgi:alanine-glyoxylate transaminase/serine-glyoxylate transaminase/serine-pyruvate transaminase